MAPSKSIVYPVLTFSKDRQQNQSTESLQALVGVQNQQEKLALDVELWSKLEDDLMQAQTHEEVIRVITQMHTFISENQDWLFNIGRGPIIQAGKRKRELSPEVWSPSVAKSYGSLLRLIKLKSEPNVEKFLSPEASPSSVKAFLDHRVSPRSSNSTQGETNSSRLDNNLDYFFRRGFFISMLMCSLLIIAGVECLVLLTSNIVFSAFPYVIAVLLVIFAVLVIPFSIQRLLNAGIDANTISLLALKVIILKLFRNAAFSLVFFCFAGAPAQFDVSAYNYAIAGMAILIQLIVGYMMYLRSQEVIAAYMKDDAALEAEIFTEETGYALTIEYHDDAFGGVA